jgi:hypothetical protein
LASLGLRPFFMTILSAPSNIWLAFDQTTEGLNYTIG